MGKRGDTRSEEGGGDVGVVVLAYLLLVQFVIFTYLVVISRGFSTFYSTGVDGFSSMAECRVYK